MAFPHGCLLAHVLFTAAYAVVLKPATEAQVNGSTRGPFQSKTEKVAKQQIYNPERSRKEIWEPVLNRLPTEQRERIRAMLDSGSPPEAQRWPGLWGVMRNFPKINRAWALNPEGEDPLTREIREKESAGQPQNPNGELGFYNAVGQYQEPSPWQRMVPEILDEASEAQPLKYKESKVLKDAQLAVSRGPPSRLLFAFPVFEYTPLEGYSGMFVEFGMGIQMYPSNKQWWQVGESGHGHGESKLWKQDGQELTIALKWLSQAIGLGLVPLSKIFSYLQRKGKSTPLIDQLNGLPNVFEAANWRIADLAGRLAHLRLGYKFSNGIKVFSHNLFGIVLGKGQYWKFLEGGVEIPHAFQSKDRKAEDGSVGWRFKVRHGYCPILTSPTKESGPAYGPTNLYVELGYAGYNEKQLTPERAQKYYPGGNIQIGNAWENFDKTMYINYDFYPASSSTIRVGYFEESDYLLPELAEEEDLTPKQKVKVIADYQKLAAMRAVAEQTAAYVPLCLEDERTKNRFFRKHGPCELWDLKKYKTGDILFFADGGYVSWAVRTWTNADTHHSTLIIWLSWQDGKYEIEKGWCATCIITLCETTSYPTRDIVTGVVDAGFMIRHLHNKISEQPIDTRMFVRHRKEELTDDQVMQLVAMTDCLYTRRPLYLYGPGATGKESMIRKAIMSNEKVTNPQDETWDRGFCSQLTGFIVEVWNEDRMTFMWPKGKPTEGVPVQQFQEKYADWTGKVHEFVGRPMLPGDFTPHDLAYMNHADYDKLTQFERPWHGFKRFRQEILTHESFMRRHSEPRSWQSLANSCMNNIHRLEFAKKFMPYWFYRMVGVAQKVSEGDISDLEDASVEETITGWLMEGRMRDKADFGQEIELNFPPELPTKPSQFIPMGTPGENKKKGD